MLEYKNGRIYSEEGEVTCDRLSLCYTKKEENLRDIPRVECNAYGDRRAEFGGEAEALGARFSVRQEGKGLFFTLTGGENFSEFGINLPVDFMGKKGGKWEKQYLFNSPYRSENNEHIYIYLTSPERKNLLLLFEGGADGWKMDYSPYVGGHYFYNLKLLASFPREYGAGQKYSTLQFSLWEVETFEEALALVAGRKGLPAVYPKLNADEIGKVLPVQIYGACDRVEYGGKDYLPVDGAVEIPLQEGILHVTPYVNGKRGLDCTVFGYESLQALYKRYLDGIVRDGLVKPYDNLCEGQCWLSATLRYLRKYGYDETLGAFAKNTLDQITCDSEENAHKRFSLLSKPHESYPAYHIYQSGRIQEQFFGVGILMDGYYAFRDEKYLRYAQKVLDCALETAQKEDGRIEIYSAWLGVDEDYSTVCCPLLNIAEMSLACKGIDDDASARYAESAKRLAAYLYERGLSFPTEGGFDAQAETEMEDGSISCTALALLYCHLYIEKNEDHVKKALDILSLHENWVTKTPLCCMQGSSLRWWETAWEGDEDGPALCMGHAWTIWRAEADYLAYQATGEEKYLLQARRGYNTNFAKIDKQGRSYAIYQIDYITGWRFFAQKDIRYELAKEFPERHDNGLTGYAWSRAFKTLLDNA